MTEVSRLVTEARKQLGISQLTLAKCLGYTSPQMVSNWERGLCSPSFASLNSICKVLKIDRQVMREALLNDYTDYIDQFI